MEEIEFAIETEALSKSYGQVRAVDSVSLQVKRGEIYGFIGLNGAGKTTTIRLLLGMLRPNAGKIRLLGQPVGPRGRGPWRQVGHLVESPSAYPELTVWENLDIARGLYGVEDSAAIDRVIDRLELTVYTRRKAGELSTGNLQRLGLARALLHQPELLILDEPANGLDPAGVVEIRELLRELAHEDGVTVFMSSHILTEVDRLADRIGIIHQGRLIEEHTAQQMEALRRPRLEVQARDLEAAAIALEQAGFLAGFKADRLEIFDSSAIQAPDEVAAILAQAGTPPTRLAVEQEDLEEYFLRLTGGNL